ncbi:MAG: ABC transporter ATP-binding protein [Verrucomicrobia bacterium]|nr:ABC transporter ATP-binding protein [Verrucomicrobiota bacterium]
MIQLRDLNKRFGRRPAVIGLSLEVRRGDVFGLLGHNGAGKSTTIGMLLGQVWPSSGTALIQGHDVASDRARALARVGAIFEAPAFYDYLSGWRNLEILSGYTGPTAPARLREVLDWVGLSGREGQAVRTYSHGMRARLALAQALVPNPELLILDEPTNGLDPEGIHEMRATIRRLHAELGLTLLLSSHLLTEVEQLCSRIAVLNQGRKVFEGALAEARQAQDWVRVGTDDFPAAVRMLTTEGLVTRSQPEGLVSLAAGVPVSAVTKRLVDAGFAVHEIRREVQTLEQFYLSLMKEPAPLESVASLSGENR